MQSLVSIQCFVLKIKHFEFCEVPDERVSFSVARSFILGGVYILNMTGIDRMTIKWPVYRL